MKLGIISMINFLNFWSVFLNSSVGKEPLKKINTFIRLNHFFSIRFVFGFATLLKHLLMVNHIFKDINVSSLKFFVFYYTSGEKNIKTAVFCLLEIFVKSIALSESLRLNRSSGILTVPHKKHIFILLTTAVFWRPRIWTIFRILLRPFWIFVIFIFVRWIVFTTWLISSLTQQKALQAMLIQLLLIAWKSVLQSSGR